MEFFLAGFWVGGWSGGGVGVGVGVGVGWVWWAGGVYVWEGGGCSIFCDVEQLKISIGWIFGHFLKLFFGSGRCQRFIDIFPTFST